MSQDKGTPIEQLEAEHDRLVAVVKEKGIGTSPSPPSPPEHIMQFFSFAHLPEPLASVSQPFCAMADWLVTKLPRNPERTVALRKLLEAKDAAVRALVAK